MESDDWAQAGYRAVAADWKRAAGDDAIVLGVANFLHPRAAFDWKRFTLER
jgi:hypothetical protein